MEMEGGGAEGGGWEGRGGGSGGGRAGGVEFERALVIETLIEEEEDMSWTPLFIKVFRIVISIRFRALRSWSSVDFKS